MVTTVDVRGIPHAYELTAPRDSSTVLVFLHGWLLSRAYWQPVVQQLMLNYQCLTYDLRGFGESQLPATVQRPARAVPVVAGAIASDLDTRVGRSPTPPAYTPESYAQDLKELLDQLNLSQVWLIGHSLGGSIALWAADQIPQVQGVICVNSGGGIYLKEEFERFRAAGEQLVKLRPRWLCHLPFVDLMLTWMNVARPISRAWGRQRLLDLVMADPEAALGTLLDSTTEAEVHRLPQVVSRLQQPVHFIAGANDTVMEPQYVRHLASFHRLFQQGEDNVQQVPNCGHLAMVEQPEIVADYIRKVLCQYCV